MKPAIYTVLLLLIAICGWQCSPEDTAPRRPEIPPRKAQVQPETAPPAPTGTDRSAPKLPALDVYAKATQQGSETNSKGITREELAEIAAAKTPEALHYLVDHADWSDATPAEQSIRLFRERLPCLDHITSFGETAVPVLVRSLNEPHEGGLDGALVRLHALNALAGTERAVQLLTEAAKPGDEHAAQLLVLLKKFHPRDAPAEGTDLQVPK